MTFIKGRNVWPLSQYFKTDLRPAADTRPIRVSDRRGGDAQAVNRPMPIRMHRYADPKMVASFAILSANLSMITRLELKLVLGYKLALHI